MIRTRKAIVHRVDSTGEELTEIQVELAGTLQKAVNFNKLTGPVAVGNEVLLNTTAVFKGLGTGGVHFVMANLSGDYQEELEEAGHIMKLRYTPMQIKTWSAEEEDSPHRKAIEAFSSLNGTPVVAGSLHSQVPLIAAGIKMTSNSQAKIAYIMTDGGALPMAFSKLVQQMQAKGLIDATITVGHAFGGDYEAVNVYSGLAVAKAVVKADVIIVAMGPGIVGTGTTFGYTGTEQAEILNAVIALDGKAIAVPRMSFADPRERHTGISHHSITVLDRLVLGRCVLPVPKLEDAKAHYVHKQLLRHGLTTKHQVLEVKSNRVLDILREKYQLRVTTMGRDMDQDTEFFLAAAAAGMVAADHIVY